MIKAANPRFTGRLTMLALIGTIGLLVPSFVPLKGAVATGCDPGHSSNQPATSRTEDVIYGRKFGMALTMDVFEPAQKNGFGVIFLVNGAWYSSHDPVTVPFPFPCVTPDNYKPYLDSGYTVFAVVTSSAPKFSIPEVIEDLYRAVRFIRYNAAKFGVKPESLGVLGSSSGGHLALMMGTQGTPGPTDAQDPIDRESSAVGAVACFFPPTDFLNWGAPGVDGVGLASMAFLAIVFGPRAYTEQGRQNLGREISPIYFVTSKMPPTLIIHGDADNVVPLQQSESFVKRAEEVGAPRVKLVVRKGKSHGWGDFWKSQEDITLFVEWFDEYLRGIRK
ncbi:MAG TPA: alpha/beta hydrolase [Terriglobia bacterium]|nr:alpha/beta hydrolase [Terriglobia bacterium]